MSENSKIEWCHHTFNPWTQCTPVSTGCVNCYASALSQRFGGDAYKKGNPRKRTSEANWKLPLKWNRDAEKTGERPRVFCASLADVFDEEAPNEWRADLFDLIRKTPNLDWLLLTKRPENILNTLVRISNSAMFSTWDRNESLGKWASNWFFGYPPANVWLGTSVENQDAADKRIPVLLNVPAKVHFLSCEPLLGEVDLTDVNAARDQVPDSADSLGGICYPSSGHEPFKIKGVDWVICGGESGSNARAMRLDWAISLKRQCEAAKVPFFMKQLGSNPMDGARCLKHKIRDKKGGDISEFPTDLQVRQFPNI